MRPRPSPAAPTPTKFSPRGLHDPASSEIQGGWGHGEHLEMFLHPHPQQPHRAGFLRAGAEQTLKELLMDIPLMDTPPLWCCSFPCTVGTSWSSLSSVLRPH